MREGLPPLPIGGLLQEKRGGGGGAEGKLWSQDRHAPLPPRSSAAGVEGGGMEGEGGVTLTELYSCDIILIVHAF